MGRNAPCTAYRVRRALKASPSTHWSGSAGSIYPLIARLVERGFLASAQDEADGRGRSVLSLTARGVTALRTWVLQASRPEVAASVFDGVRARAFFLDALPSEDRVWFAESALHALEEFLQHTREYESAEGSTPTSEKLAAQGAVRSAGARVEWMREVLAASRRER